MNGCKSIATYTLGVQQYNSATAITAHATPKLEEINPQINNQSYWDAQN